jgi:L-Ala-D/L-Glu epimerase
VPDVQLLIREEDWPVAGVFNIARGPQTVAHVVVVELRDGPHAGRGECEPQKHYGESVASVLAQIEALRPALGRGLGREQLLEVLPAGAARNAVDCALWDLEAKRSGTPAWQLAGLAPPGPITTDFTISLDTPQAMHARALAYSDWAFLKIKLAGDAEDIARVEAVRAAAPRTRFTVDANESWTLAQLTDRAPRLAALGVELIEQPLPAGRDAALAGYRSPIPLCADESCHTVASLAAIVGRYQFVNIKLDKTGGLTEALRLARAARAQGLRLMTGCMTGTSLAMAPALLVAGLSEFVDLDGPLLLRADRVPGIHYDQGVAAPAPPALWG